MSAFTGTTHPTKSPWQRGLLGESVGHPSQPGHDRDAKSADARAIASAQPTTVWVANKLVPTGTTLKDAQRTGLIAQTQVPASALPAGALQDINADNNAQLALSDVQPGELPAGRPLRHHPGGHQGHRRYRPACSPSRSS